MIKNIVVTSYNLDWPKLFEAEAVKIKEALGDNCIALHHIGSTSVPGLSAKPIIDMIGVIKYLDESIQPLENLGFTHKGEYNIPMRLYFNRTEKVKINLHLYEDGHPEIELNLVFRDYLRDHPEAREEYSHLKEELLKDQSSYVKKNSMFTGYNLGKDSFIRKILKTANYSRIRMMRCTHYAEWETAKKLRNLYFFEPLGIEDPYTWTFDHKDHIHLILYRGVDMIGYAHLQLWENQKAAIRILVIDKAYQHQSFGSQFLKLCERWLKRQGIQSLHTEARQDVQQFYLRNGFIKMPFNDPSGSSTDPQDVAMGKNL